MSLRGKELIFGKEVADWVWARADQSIGESVDDFAAIGLKRNQIVSGVVFTRFTGASIDMAIASEGSTWAVPNYFRSIFAYPFIQLPCRRATAIVGAKNLKSRQLCEKLGFSQEGYLRYGFEDDDAVVYGIYRNGCRWIQ